MNKKDIIRELEALTKPHGEDFKINKYLRHGILECLKGNPEYEENEVAAIDDEAAWLNWRNSQNYDGFDSYGNFMAGRSSAQSFTEAK